MQQGAPSRGSGGCWGRGKTEMWSVNVVEVEIIFITITQTAVTCYLLKLDII